MRPETPMNGEPWDAPVPDEIWNMPEDAYAPAGTPGYAYPPDQNNGRPPMTRMEDPAATAAAPGMPYAPQTVPLQQPQPDPYGIPEDWGEESIYPDAVYAPEMPRKRSEKQDRGRRGARSVPGYEDTPVNPIMAQASGAIPPGWGDEAQERPPMRPVPGYGAYLPERDRNDIPADWGKTEKTYTGRARLRPEEDGRQSSGGVERPRAGMRGEGQKTAQTAGTSAARKAFHPLPWVLVCIICALLLGWMGWRLVDAYFISGEAAHRTRVNAVYGNRFPEGTFVDDVAIGGMTRSEAEALLTADRTEAVPKINITVTVRGGGSYRVTNDNIPFYRNTAAVLNEAMNLTRQGMADTLLSPVEYRSKKAEQIRDNGAYYYTRITYSKGDVQQVVRAIGAAETIPAADATVAAFDFTTRSFVFSDEVIGRAIDTEALYAGLTSMLDNGQYTGELVLETASVQPAVTRTKLLNTFTMIASYSTTSAGDPEQNMNIMLACEALNGTVVNSGESFSFNACTGERTTVRGYLIAGAVRNGATADDVDGGVCQVSSTLLNAAAMADMTITARTACTWTVSYADKGRDAMVCWPDVDLCFRNDKDAPVFIAAYFADGQCTVEFYGVAPTSGETIDLVSVVTGTELPPSEPEYVLNPELMSGTRRETRKAHTGYTVETYRIYKLNGVEYRRVKLFDSVYQMIRQMIEYNQ